MIEASVARQSALGTGTPVPCSAASTWVQMTAASIYFMRLVIDWLHTTCMSYAHQVAHQDYGQNSLSHGEQRCAQ
jgi:hypothetical protein